MARHTVEIDSLDSVAAAPHFRRASFRSRWGAAIAVAGVLALLGVARQLEPSPLGFGTHQQLGLPPCTSMLLWDMRCPACGMTTSWSYAVRGRWLDAWRSNAGGALLVAIALVFVPLGCYFVVRGYWSRHGWLSFSLALCLTVALMLAVGQW
ncbi:MAG: DUF2752 domain-containing protein, partial [Pirellulaceae bacterium]|nr:DUF2752 domain-containing protein [Pirellulaceae bacterium]